MSCKAMKKVSISYRAKANEVTSNKLIVSLPALYMDRFFGYTDD